MIISENVLWGFPATEVAGHDLTGLEAESPFPAGPGSHCHQAIQSLLEEKLDGKIGKIQISYTSMTKFNSQSHVRSENLLNPTKVSAENNPHSVQAGKRVLFPQNDSRLSTQTYLIDP